VVCCTQHDAQRRGEARRQEGLAPIGVPVEALLAIANRRSDGNSVAKLLVDTGFLVALYRRNDELHQSALRFLQGNREGLITVAPVIVEACHFLAIEARMHLLQWITREGLTVLEIPQAVYSKLAALMEKNRNLDCDLADVALLWVGTRTPYPPPTQGDFSALNKAAAIASGVARRPVTSSMLIR